MMRYIFSILALSLCINAEAQLGIKPILKAGVRTYGFSTFFPFESEGVSADTWYTYSASIHISKFHTSIEGTYREWGRTSFLKVPNALIKKPKIIKPIVMPMVGDTSHTALDFTPSWFSVSFNVFPNKWKKHQLLLGGGLIKRHGGLSVVDDTGGFEILTHPIADFSQKTVLWKTEYNFMPYKYSLLSFRCNYAYFSRFPHSYYEFILSLGTYIDL